MHINLCVVTGLFALFTASAHASEGPTRDEVLARAKAYAEHPWKMTKSNVTGTCQKKGYKSDYEPGAHTAVPYAWGGFMTLADFDKRLAAGLGAGSHSQHGVLRCVAGVDCSGFVSQVWGLKSKQSTSTLKNVTNTILMQDLRPGDALNKAGRHVVLWAGRTETGDPIIYEASGYHSRVRLATPGWKYLSGYVPIRYPKIKEPLAAAVAADPKPQEPEPTKEEIKTAEPITVATNVSAGDAEVLLRFQQEVGFQPADADALPLGPDYLAARNDNTAAVYDRVRKRAVIVSRGQAPTSFDVGHADGLIFGLNGQLVVLDGVNGQVRFYRDNGTLDDEKALPSRLPLGASLELKDARLYATTPNGKKQTVATLVGGRLVPGPGRPPSFETPNVLRSRSGSVVRFLGRSIRIPPAQELSWRVLSEWLEIEWVESGANASLNVKRIARRRRQTVTLPSGPNRSYTPFSDVTATKQSLIFLHPIQTGVKVVWVDVDR